MSRQIILFVGCTLLSGCSQHLPPPVNVPEFLGACSGPVPESGPVQHDPFRIYFPFDSSTPLNSSEGTLSAQAQWLVKCTSVDVQIAGNADERGTETYNLALGMRRADAVREYLIAKGVVAQRIKTISYGKDRPVDPGHDEEAWQQNRNAITSTPDYDEQRGSLRRFGPPYDFN